MLDARLDDLTDRILLADPTLVRAEVRTIVARVVVNFPRADRLLASVDAEPSLMTSGDAAMPRALQRIIAAVQGVCATTLQLPTCQRCGKTSTGVLSRLEEQRLCSSCVTAVTRLARTCVTCGSNTRSARFGDRWAYCRLCWIDLLPRTEALLARVLCENAASVTPALLHSAIAGAAATPADRLRLVLDVRTHGAEWLVTPNLGSAAFLRLHDALRDEHPHLPVPTCATCGEVRPLPCTLDGRGGPRICRRCHAARFAEPCSKCASVSTITRRLPSGEGLCQKCDKTAPERSSRCVQCDEVRVVAARTNEGAVCGRCRFSGSVDTCVKCHREVPCRFASTERAICDNCRKPRVPCTSCGRARIVNTRDADGAPLCHQCADRPPEACIACGEVRRVTGRVDGQALCEHCYPKHPVSFRDCARCSQHRKIRRSGLCDRCTADDLVESLFSAQLLEANEPSRRLRQALMNGDEERTLLAFQRPRSVRLLGDVLRSAQPITHELLDQMGNEQTTRNVRAVLVEYGLLEQIDFHLSRFEAWIPTAASDIVDLIERAAFVQFATWVHVRKLRSRPSPIPGSLTVSRRVELRLVIDLLAWLRARGSSLASMTQEHLDRWSITQREWHRVTKFLRWARRNRLVAELTVRQRQIPAVELGGISDQERTRILGAILRDHAEIPAGTKLAAALVLLYGIRPHQIVRIKLDQIASVDGLWKIRVGAEDLYLPDQLGVVAEAVTAARGARRMLHTASDHEWLLPGTRAGYPLASHSLTERLRKLDIPVAPARKGAISSLAQDLDPSVLAALVGIHIQTAVRWRSAVAASRARYVGELLREVERY